MDNVKNNKAISIKEYRIANTIGVEVDVVDGNAKEIDLFNLSKGVYIIQVIYTDNTISFQKIILE